MKNLKRVLALVLCIAMLSCAFVGSPQQASAIGPQDLVIADGVYQIIVWVLACLGVTVAYKGGLIQAIQQYCYDNPDIFNYLTNNWGSMVTGESTLSLKMQLSIDALKWIKGTLMPSLSKYFSRTKSAVEVDKDGYFTYDTAQITPYSADARTLFNMAPYSEVQTISITSNGVSFVYSLADCSYGYANGKKVMLNGKVCYTKDYSSSWELNASYVGKYAKKTFRWGFVRYLNGTIPYLQPYVAGQYIKDDGTVHYSCGIYDKKYYYGSMCLQQENIIQNTYGIPISYVINYDYSEFMAALQKLIDSMTGSIAIPIPGIGQDVVEGKAELEDETKDRVPYVPDWALWWEKLGIKDWMKTVEQSKTQTETDIKTPELPVDIKDKFPFCVPFDLIALVKALNAPAVVPSATIPLKFGSLYNGSITISLGQFEKVAMAVRWGMTLLFLFGLTVLTRKLIKG